MKKFAILSCAAVFVNIISCSSSQNAENSKPKTFGDIKDAYELPDGTMAIECLSGDFELGVSNANFTSNVDAYCNASLSSASYAKKIADAYTVLCADKNVRFGVSRDQLVSGNFCKSVDLSDPELSMAILRSDHNYNMKCSNSSFQLNMSLAQVLESTLCYQDGVTVTSNVCATADSTIVNFEVPGEATDTIKWFYEKDGIKTSAPTSEIYNESTGRWSVRWMKGNPDYTITIHVNDKVFVTDENSALANPCNP